MCVYGGLCVETEDKAGDMRVWKFAGKGTRTRESDILLKNIVGSCDGARYDMARSTSEVLSRYITQSSKGNYSLAPNG